MRSVLHLRRSWPGRAAVTVLDGAAESIPVADGSIDALWTVNTIHHWTDRERASSELARVVRPGGVKPVSLPHRDAARASRADLQKPSAPVADEGQLEGES
jgi:SAM-dependent methyltransferase